MAKLRFRKWLNQLAGRTIKGGAAALGAMTGMALSGDKLISTEQLLSGFLGGALFAGLIPFLSKSPVPNFEEDGEDTTITPKPKE